MSNYLTHLKRTKMHYSNRWIVKYTNSNPPLVREVKLIFNPAEYVELNAKRYGDKARKLKTKNQLIKILENDKEKRRNKA